MNEAHSRAIVYLLAAILCVMLFGASAFLSGVAWGAGIAAVVAAVFLAIVGAAKLFISLRSDVEVARSERRPWLYLPVLWFAILGNFAVFAAAALQWVRGGIDFRAALDQVPYWWLPVSLMLVGALILICESAPNWLPRLPGQISAFLQGWLHLITAPVFGPVGRWRAIREARARGERIGRVSAGASVAATFFVGTLLWFPAVLLPLVLLAVVVHEISR
jgi:hypothetical protein